MKVLLEGLNIFDVNLYTFDVRFPYKHYNVRYVVADGRVCD